MKDPTEFEKHIINLLFDNKEFRDTVFPYLQFEVFDTQEQVGDIYNAIVAFNETHDKFPTKTEFDVHASKYAFYTAWKEIRTLNSTDYETEFLLTEVQNHIKQKLLMTVRENITSLLKKDQFDRISEIQDQLTDVSHFSFKKDVGLDLFEDPEDIYEHLFDDANKITTGLKSLDYMLKGGYYEDSLTLYIAATNQGKTAVLCHTAAALLKEGKSVLYISLEENRYRISQRMLQNIFTVNQEDLKIKSTFMNMFEQTKKTLSSKLYIIDPPDGELRCDDIYPHLKELKDKKSFVPDIILIDYIGCMVPNRKSTVTEKNYEKVKAVVTEIKALCRKLKATVVSAAQLNRGGAKSENPELSDLADAYDLAKKCDFAFMMYQDSQLKQSDLMRFQLVKSRAGNKDMCVNLIFDINKQMFKDDINWKTYQAQTNMIDKFSAKRGQVALQQAISSTPTMPSVQPMSASFTSVSNSNNLSQGVEFT